MTFYEILEQVLALLQRYGRLSYRALKVQFALDDAHLDLLKEELIDIQQVARDQDERMLVWTGRTETSPLSAASVPPSPLPQARAPHDVSSRAASPPAPLSPDAERRQLTVMFCDLVDSTALAGQLDPEDWREVVRAYQRVCTDVIQRFDGHVAQLLGDGLLVYFGYPQAHEDDPQRAVRTGLGILAAMGDLNQSLPQAKGIQLAVRVGMHTGLVVIGDMGEAGRQEQLALGETPNVAARMQGLAEPNTVAISAATYRLVQGFFEFQALGAQTLRGVSQPTAVYRVLQDSGARGRLDVAQPRGLTPLVGRESEVTFLRERWEQAKAGHGYVVLLRGEGGIGKSRLVQVLKDDIAHEPHVRWECRSAEFSQNTALFPLVDLLQRILRFEAHETPDEKLGKLAHALSQSRLPVEDSVPLLAPLLSLVLPDNRSPLLHLSPQRQRQKTLETLVALLVEQAEHHPVLFILEDLHWTDPTTLEFIALLLDQTPTASLLVLLTCRPSFHPAWHHRSYLTEITVNRLSQTQVEQIVTRMTDGKTFPAAVLRQIIAKTDGVPLFVEEITKAILESGQLKALDGHYALAGSLSTFAIPTTLQDSLMARLDRLVTAKAVAQYAAVIGRQFPYALLQAVAHLDESTLQRELARLVEAEIVYQRGLPPQAYYFFKHALIQDAAYASLLKSTRQQYHQHIAQILEVQFSEVAEAQPELLAHHYTDAGCTDKAVHYWHQAGQSAIKRSSYVEAISHLRQGLALLQTLLETPERLQHEVDLLIALGASLRATQGTAALEVGETYTRARHLCHHLDNPRQLFPVLRGLCMYHYLRAELQTAQALGEQLLTLAQQVQDFAMLLAAHRSLGAILSHVGAVAESHTHFMQGIALYDRHPHRTSKLLYGEDTGVTCRIFDAWTLWYLGSPDQGLARSYEALTLAQQVAHPYSLSYALCWAAVSHQLRRERGATQEHATAAMSLATAQGFPYWIAFDAILHGWALAHQGQAQEGIEQINHGLTAFRATGAEILRPYFLALLAEAYGIMGQQDAGLEVLTEALRHAETMRECWYEPELYRLKGALLLQQSSDNQVEAERDFHHALDIARTHQAKSFELRTATSVARLWQQQGKRQEAHALLAPVYGWFTEGFDTADLQEAKVLLEILAG